MSKYTLKEIFDKAAESFDRHALAKQANDLGKKINDRICECGHECRNHNFVPHQDMISKGYPGAKVPDSCKSCECKKFKHDNKNVR